MAPAIVLSWDGNTAKVLYPFCHKIHTHAFRHFAFDERGIVQDKLGRYSYDGPSPSRCECRISHCNHDVDVDVCYTILFPFEDDERVADLDFELERVDKGGGGRGTWQFRTVGVDAVALPRVISIPRKHEEVKEEEVDEGEGEEEEEEDELKTRSRLRNLTMQDGDDDAEQPSIILQSAAVIGDVKEMESVLSQSPQAQSLLKTQTEGGQSLLSLAVPNGHKDAVKFLLAKDGIEVDTVDEDGRTPLMEAALWTHPDIVAMFLEAGADSAACDSAGRTAADVAAESDENDEERHKRSRKYAEDPFTAKRHRRLIGGLLGDYHEPSLTLPKSILLRDGADAHFYKSPRAQTISLIIPTAGIHISTQWKTAAFLHRSDALPIVSAISGWSGPNGGEEFLEPGDLFKRINGQFWMPEVLRIANSLGFAFDSHPCDHKDEPGSYYACHAEAMLMCFFVKRHYLFRDDYDEDDVVYDDFLQLFLLQPRKTLAAIVVSNRPCDSCIALRDCIKPQLGFELWFKMMEVREGKA